MNQTQFKKTLTILVLRALRAEGLLRMAPLELALSSTSTYPKRNPSLKLDKKKNTNNPVKGWSFKTKERKKRDTNLVVKIIFSWRRRREASAVLWAMCEKAMGKLRFIIVTAASNQ